jgi:galactose mutarotase-like enzyme
MDLAIKYIGDVGNAEGEASSTTISLEGGQVRSWSLGTQDILYQGSSIKRSGIPILFPYANPLKEDILLVSGKKYGQHGFARDCSWRLLEKGQDFCRIILDRGSLSQEMQDFYPFNFSLIQTILVSKDSLSIELEVCNLEEVGGKSMPIAPGLHPYFSLDHKQKAGFEISGLSTSVTAKSYEKIDWEKPSNGYFFKLAQDLEKNHSFETNILHKSAGTIKLEISPNFQNLVLWSQSPSEGKTDYNFICLEPFSRGADAINTAPILIAPGDKEIFKFKISYES